MEPLVAIGKRDNCLTAKYEERSSESRQQRQAKADVDGAGRVAEVGGAAVAERARLQHVPHHVRRVLRAIYTRRYAGLNRRGGNAGE